MRWLVTVLSCGPVPCSRCCSVNCVADHGGHTGVAAPLSIMRLTHLLSSVKCCAVPIVAIVTSCSPETGLLMSLLVVAVLVVASVSDPGGTSCCHSVPDCTSHLSGHWCRSCQCRSCRSPLYIVWPCVLVVRIRSNHLLLAFLLLLFLLVDCCSIPCLSLCCCILFLCHILVVLVPFAFSFVAVSFSFAISLLSWCPFPFPLLLFL